MRGAKAAPIPVHTRLWLDKSRDWTVLHQGLRPPPRDRDNLRQRLTLDMLGITDAPGRYLQDPPTERPLFHR